MSDRQDQPSSTLLNRLANLFAKPEPLDDAARALLDEMKATTSRMEKVREEVQRGVRGREDRFRL